MNQEKNSIVKNRLNAVRKKHNSTQGNKKISQKEMAEICHTSKSAIQRAESGGVSTADILYGYRETFGVSMEYLAGYSTDEEYKNATISHELGLTDEAVETLKYIKQMSWDDDDISALVSAFIGSREKTYSLFRNMFDALTADWLQTNYEEHHQADMNRFLMEQEITNSYMNYVKFYIRPKLEKVIAQSYKKLMDEANKHPADIPEKIQNKLSMLQEMKRNSILE